MERAQAAQGPSFSVRPEKEAKGAVLHGTSAAERLRHVETRSANLPKLDDSHRLKHMGRFVFALRAKIPSRATQKDSAGAASASRQRPAAHKPAEAENAANVALRLPGGAVSPCLPMQKMLVTKPIINHAFCALFSSFRLDRQAGAFASRHHRLTNAFFS